MLRSYLIFNFVDLHMKAKIERYVNIKSLLEEVRGDKYYYNVGTCLVKYQFQLFDMLINH